MSGEGWICRDRETLSLCFEHLLDNWDFASSPVMIKWDKASNSRSLGQLALCHVWIRGLTKYFNDLQVKDDNGNIVQTDEGTMKKELKRQFGIRIQVFSPITQKEITALKSLGRYEKGEMFDFMTRIDAYSASIGCMLPCWGEYDQLRMDAK